MSRKYKENIEKTLEYEKLGYIPGDAVLENNASI